MYQQIEYRIEGSSAVVTLNRPVRLNALTAEALGELKDALTAAERDKDVTGVVVTGAGRGFCSGMDISTLLSTSSVDKSGLREETGKEADAPGDRSMGDDFSIGLSYLMTIRKPIIAAINGPCAGMGMSLALFCDLRIASDKAVFVTAFSRRGLVAEHGQSWLLPRVIGPSKALDLLWTSRRVEAPEAKAIGLVDELVTPEELIPYALNYINTLNDYTAPYSLMMMKRQVYRHLNMSLGAALVESDSLIRASIGRTDAQEGVASYLEKRKPKFARIDSL